MCENGDAFSPENRATHCEPTLCMGEEHAGFDMFFGFLRIARQVPLRVLDLLPAIAAELLRVFWKQPVLEKKLCSGFEGFVIGPLGGRGLDRSTAEPSHVLAQNRNLPKTSGADGFTRRGGKIISGGWHRRSRRGSSKLWHHTNRNGSIGRTCGTITVVLPTIVLPIYYRIQLSKRSKSPLVPFPLGSRSQLLLPLGSRSQLLLLPLPLITTVIPLPTITALPT